MQPYLKNTYLQSQQQVFECGAKDEHVSQIGVGWWQTGTQSLLCVRSIRAMTDGKILVCSRCIKGRPKRSFAHKQQGGACLKNLDFTSSK